MKLLYKISEEDQRAQFLDLTKNAKVAIVCFSAPWCGPCKKLSMELDTKLGDILEAKSENISDCVVLLKVDIDEFEDLAKVYEVKSIPHTVFYKKGELQVDVTTGCQSDKIVEKVKELLN
jgi:thioredoxin 1